MSVAQLESALRDLPRIGTLVKDRGYRQVWRFVHQDHAYYLKFYPKGGPRDRFRRFFRGSPALREFTRLQALQRANIPAPRAVAVLMGFLLNHRHGDAVIIQAIDPSIQLDEYINRFQRAGQPIENHRKIAAQIRALVLQLGRAKLGHEDLHLGNFLMQDGNLFLLDGYAVRTSGMKIRDLLMLGHSVREVATTTDLLRGWNELGPGGPLPKRNPVSDFLWPRFLQGITRSNRYFGRLNLDGWTGVFFKQTKQSKRWSTASHLEISAADWETAWPKLWQQIQSDQLEILKRTRSGNVLAGEITLAEKTIPIIIKRPRRRYWYRYLNEIGRGSRALRAWKKSWNMLVRGLPAAWPLAVLEKKTAGYVTDAILITERVPGNTLAAEDLNTLPPTARQMLLHRVGAILRKIEQLGFSHFDAKASNWMVYTDLAKGPTPIMIDIDGIRRRRWPALGIRRLLRSMTANPTYTPADSLSLCHGYAPWAKLVSPPAQTSEKAEPSPQV